MITMNIVLNKPKSAVAGRKWENSSWIIMLSFKLHNYIKNFYKNKMTKFAYKLKSINTFQTWVAYIKIVSDDRMANSA